MKKLVLLFVILLAIVIVVGFSARRKNGEFAKNETTTLVTTLDEESSEPLTVIPTTNPAVTGELTVTSPTENPLETSAAYHLVRGTTPKGTLSITVNGYKLRKYRPGQAQWRYIAAAYVNTLKEGKNDYEVKALNSQGSIIATTSFAINYTPTRASELPGTGSSPLIPGIVAALLILVWLGFNKSKKIEYDV